MILSYDFTEIVSWDEKSKLGMPLQNCPNCSNVIGAFPGGRDSTCKNCGYKDPCCE